MEINFTHLQLSVSLKLQSTLLPAVKFYEAWLMLEQSVSAHRFSPEHALQPAALRSATYTRFSTVVWGPFTQQNPQENPHESLENVAVSRLWPEHWCAVLSWDKRQSVPRSSSAGNRAHQVTWIARPPACVRMTANAQGMIWQLQISAMDEFSDMESVNNEDWLAVYQNKKEIHFQPGRLEKQ